MLPRYATLAGILVLASGCIFPHAMERAGPVGAACPLETMPAAGDAPADTSSLRWFRPAQPKDQSEGSRACAAVDDPAFSPDPSGRFGSWRVGDPLTVVSWNGDEGDGDLPGLLTAELGARCSDSASTIESGQPLFVVLAQRTVRGADQADVIETAERCGLAYHYVASSAAGDGRDRGNAILSTVPLSSPIAVELPAEGTRRVAVGATVLLPGGERMRLVSTDVDGSSSLLRTLVGANQVRARQVLGLIEGLDAADDDGPLNAATLVGGDFSSWHPTETALREMRESFAESPAWDGQATHGSYARDHIFFRRGSFRNITVGNYTRVEERYGSSHHPRRVVLNYLPIG